MKKVLLILLILVVALTGWCFFRRHFQDDEKRLREIIEQMRQAAEARNADNIIEHFSKDYSDKDGNTKLIVYGLLRNNLNRVDELRIKIEDVSVMVTGDRAWVNLRIVAEASKGGKVYYPFGSDEDPETPALTFKKSATGDWLIIKVENIKDSNF